MSREDLYSFSWLYEDELWEMTRGRRGLSSRDPLTLRIRELRGQRSPGLQTSVTVAERRQLDVERYSPAARRQERAERAAERLQGSLTASQQAALAQHQADMQRLRERMGLV